MRDALGPAHIVLVDEAPELRRMLARVLQRAGFQVTTASAVQELGTVHCLAPDCIVHELMFDHQSAATLAFLQALREDALLAHVPVILLTVAHEALTERELRAALDELDVSIVLKPAGLQDFLDTVLLVCGTPP